MPSGRVSPITKELLLDELQPAEVLRLHLQPFECRDLVQFEQQIAPERIGDAALDEGDRDEALSAADWDHLVEGVGWINHGLARLQLEGQAAGAEANAELPPLIVGGMGEEDGA